MNNATSSMLIQTKSASISVFRLLFVIDHAFFMVTRCAARGFFVDDPIVVSAFHTEN